MKIVFDMDGTLADCTHRQHFVQNKPKDWRAFFAGVEDDAPNLHVIAVALSLIFDDESLHKVEFWSGRPERCREGTVRWIKEHICTYAADLPLRMRADGDYRADDIVKEEFIAKYGRPDLIFDDRDRVVAMWRRNGIPCFQVAPGAF